MYTIKNEYLRVTVTEDGGSLTSIYDIKNKQELLYQPDERSWKGQDVVIFPFVARLKNNSYMVDNTEYSMYLYANGTCPNAHKVSQHLITMPLHMWLTDEEVDYVIKNYKEILKEYVDM